MPKEMQITLTIQEVINLNISIYHELVKLRGERLVAFRSCDTIHGDMLDTHITSLVAVSQKMGEAVKAA